MYLRCAALIEGLRLDEPTRVAGLVLAPVPHEGGFAGRELRETFNALLADSRFVSEFGRPAWGAQLGPRRRLCFVATPPIEAPDIASASAHASAVLRKLVDAFALTHGGAPLIFAAVHEQSADGVEWDPFVFMVGDGTWPGTVVERLLPSGEHVTPLEPVEVWTGAMSDPLFALWLSLHRGLAAEPRWDVKILRCSSLLEAIARESLPATSSVVDASSAPLLDHGGQPASATALRGRMYLLVADAVAQLASSDRVLLCHESRTLWDEVGVWADVRNMVAHEGLWKPPPLTTDLEPAQRRSADAFLLVGGEDGLERGWIRYTDAVSAGTELVLRAAAATVGAQTE
jgi:hypothetical protein